MPYCLTQIHFSQLEYFSLTFLFLCGWKLMHMHIRKMEPYFTRGCRLWWWYSSFSCSSSLLPFQPVHYRIYEENGGEKFVTRKSSRNGKYEKYISWYICTWIHSFHPCNIKHTPCEEKKTTRNHIIYLFMMMSYVQRTKKISPCRKKIYYVSCSHSFLFKEYIFAKKCPK